MAIKNIPPIPNYCKLIILAFPNSLQSVACLTYWSVYYWTTAILQVEIKMIDFIRAMFLITRTGVDLTQKYFNQRTLEGNF